MQIHINCAVLDLSTENSLICSLCIRGQNLVDVQNDCFEKQQIEAKKMVTFSAQNFPVWSVGDCITLAVSAVDRGPLDYNNILGVITIVQMMFIKLAQKMVYLRVGFLEPKFKSHQLLQ